MVHKLTRCVKKAVVCDQALNQNAKHKQSASIFGFS